MPANYNASLRLAQMQLEAKRTDQAIADSPARPAAN